MARTTPRPEGLRGMGLPRRPSPAKRRDCTLRRYCNFDCLRTVVFEDFLIASSRGYRKQVTIDLIEVRRLVHSCRNPGIRRSAAVARPRSGPPKSRHRSPNRRTRNDSPARPGAAQALPAPRHRLPENRVHPRQSRRSTPPVHSKINLKTVACLPPPTR